MFTVREWAFLAGGGVLALAVLGTGWSGSSRLALPLLALLVLLLLVVAADLRRKLREELRRTRRVQTAVTETGRRVAALVDASERSREERLWEQQQAQSRRLLAAVEALRLEILDEARRFDERQHRIADLHEQHTHQLGALAASVDALSERAGSLEAARTEIVSAVEGVGGRVREDRRALERCLDDALLEDEALTQLYALYRPSAPVPLAGGWAMSARTMLDVAHLVHRHRPRLVVELGSGASTVWTSYALRAIPGARLVSFDHDEEFRAETSAYLGEHGLNGSAEVRLAPLVDVSVDGDDRLWYSTERMNDLDGIDLLLVDGPPKATGEHARLPALPVLCHLLSDDALVVLDDMQRSDERAIAQLWVEQVPGLELLHGAGHGGRHGVLRYSRPSGGATPP